MTDRARVVPPPDDGTGHQNAAGPGCRFCGTPLRNTFVDLGMSPLCESYLDESELNRMEPFYPLHVYVCHQCFLVQLQEYVSPNEIFREYAYYSSYSTSWVDHARRYAQDIIAQVDLRPASSVVEIASNDGYLLQFFDRKNFSVLGIEPARNVAQAAIERGIPTITEFFGVQLVSRLLAQGKAADLLIANNVLAQVSDINDFVAGMKRFLTPMGVATIEFPHLQRLVEQTQFDTIYHEHFSYFSLLSAQAIFAAHDLTIYDVQELSTHGGSLRIYARHAEETARPVTGRVEALLAGEREAGMADVAYYESFEGQVRELKRRLLDFLIQVRREGKSIVGYGAPGKGNTLLNYCGIRTDLLDYTVDRNPHKQGKYLPGTHIPIHPPEKIAETEPDFVLILPWNLREEIMAQLAYIRDWGGIFVVPIPDVRVYS